jgi:hypothetical protein
MKVKTELIRAQIDLVKAKTRKTRAEALELHGVEPDEFDETEELEDQIARIRAQTGQLQAKLGLDKLDEDDDELEPAFKKPARRLVKRSLKRSR